jgi:nucleotide-binding universal stress UspA family protein
MEYQRIVCGVTGSAQAQKAAIRAARLAKQCGAELLYVYAADASFAHGMTVGVTLQYIEESLVKLGNHILDHAVQLAQAEGVEPRTIVRVGPALEVLRTVVLEEQADLLVIGSENRSFFERFLIKGEVESHIENLKKITGVEVVVDGPSD